MTHSELSEKLRRISAVLDSGKELISEEKIVEFQTSSQDIEGKLEEIMQSGRLLRLGIVGEVKAGKSSFLNALLFEGKDILPKAPTPMTAALTRIRYSADQQAKVVFYTENDWDNVRKSAQRYDEALDRMYNEYLARMDENDKKKKSEIAKTDIKDLKKTLSHSARKSKEEFEKDVKDSIPLEYRSCKELISMAEDNGLDVRKHLGREEVVKDDSSGGRFMDKLNEYVGAHGKYTPIVKYTELQMDNPLLEGIEVIDTPGLNDPILSRGRVTKNFLLECDAVFLVSYCGQFLGADDMNLILSSLPGEGINKAVLIGSKLDSAILQYPSQKKPSFRIAYGGTIRNCENQARDNLNSCTVTVNNGKLISQIKESLPPVCVSSVAFSAAMQLKDGGITGELEKWLADTYKRRYPDFTCDYDTLLGLSNIPDVRTDVLEKTRTEKDSIISERISSLISSQTGKFMSLLEDIANQARNNQNDLKKFDVEQLQDKIDSIKGRLDSVRITVRALFENTGADSRRAIEDLAVEIGLEMGNHGDFEVDTKSKTEHRTSTSGHLFWKKEHHWDETIVSHTANISDVYDNINKYFSECMRLINESFRKLLKIDKLKDSVKASVLAAFEQSDKDFDENRIIIPLETSLKRISLPQFNMDSARYIDMLDGMISGVADRGTVRNEDIPELKRAQTRVMMEISKDIIAELRKQGVDIDNALQKEAAVFIDNIVNQLDENLQKVQSLLENKQENLAKFDSFISQLNECKKIIRE